MGWLWLLILVIAMVAIWWLWQQQRAPVAPATTTPHRNIFNLQIGDIVQQGGSDWVVEGKLIYNQDGYEWLEYLLQDGDRHQWLCVEEDDTVVVSLLAPVPQLEVGMLPLPREITYAGETYHLAESGRARMTRQGSTLNRQAQTCDYYDYQGPHGQVLSIENWQGDIEITAGEVIHPSTLSLLPGDGQRIYGS